MLITNCKVNHIENPIGYYLDTVSVMWNVEQAIGKETKYYRVVVSLDKNCQDLIYDSGKRSETSCLNCQIDLPLGPRTKYYWQVEVWSDASEYAISEVNYFETGKLNEEWLGKWISPNFTDKTIRPYLKKGFNLKSSVKEAKVYATGIGMFELEVNGKRVSEEYFMPGTCTMDKWFQVYTFDISDKLVEGENIFGCLLGDGWAKSHFGVFGPNYHDPYFEDYFFLAEIHITYEDGNQICLGTSKEWMAAESPLIYDFMYNGEIFDANKYSDNWSVSKKDCLDWYHVEELIPENLGILTDRMSLPIKKHEELTPINIITSPRGETILDFGQNISGWVEFKTTESLQAVKLYYGEVLQDESFYQENLRSAKQEYYYISDGAIRNVSPKFVYFGFRYVKIEGFVGDIKQYDFKAYAVYSDLEQTGNIVTSNELVNQLFSNALWSQKDNFIDIPTDCPQRDERMGWTGDAQVFCGTASFNMETYQFYSKFLFDIYQDQQKRNGMVSDFVPFFVKNPLPYGHMSCAGTAVWGDAALIIPWRLYQQYGDDSILKQQYESMKGWVDWVTSEVQKSGKPFLWDSGHQLADWLALDGPIEGGTEGGTDKYYVSSIYYYNSVTILSKTAKILGDEKYSLELLEHSEAIKHAINDEYISPNGRLTVDTQCAYVIALYYKIISPELEERVLNDLVERIEKDNYHLQTGFVGTPLLCRVLSEYGRSDVAYKIFFQEDYPSWLYQVNMGATTIWERWNSIEKDGRISSTGMNSLNHYTYGAIVEWLYQYVLGIRQNENCLGFQTFILNPHITPRLQSVSGKYKSAIGNIEVNWKRIENKIEFKCIVPFDSKAKLILPYFDCKKIPIEIQKYHISDNYFMLSAGKYEFEYDLSEDIDEYLSFNNTIEELLEYPMAKEILKPFLDECDKLENDEHPNHKIQLCDALLNMNFIKLKEIKSQVNLQQIEEKLQQIKIEYY